MSRIGTAIAEITVALSILNVGSPDNEKLLRDITLTEEETPSVHTLSDLPQAHVWASLHQPDVVVVDIFHLNGTGVDFIKRFRKNPICKGIVILAIAREHDRERALLAGANELITAPLDPHQCRIQLLNVLDRATGRLRFYQSEWLENGGADAPKSAGLNDHDVVLRLLRAGEFCDRDTSAHIGRIGKISRRIAKILGLIESDCKIIEIAAPMHDIGKIGIPDSILRKPGPLTPDERKTMETHTQIGFDILKKSRSPYLQCGAQIALAHHERFDGTGYPHGSRGDEIPLSARIVAVADVYDALSSRRPYKLGWAPIKVVEYLNEEKRKHFDPQCVEALVAHIQSTVEAH